jgi:predicted enzyme related to lactoylglutathione lyase
MSVEFKHVSPTLPCWNVRATMEMYRDVLGFNINWIWDDYFGSVGNDQVEIFFQKTRQEIEPQTMYFYVDNADQLCQEFKDAGADVCEDIKSTPWGMREFLVRDNSGHLLRFGNVEKDFKEIENFRFG